MLRYSAAKGGDKVSAKLKPHLPDMLSLPPPYTLAPASPPSLCLRHLGNTNHWAFPLPGLDLILLPLLFHRPEAMAELKLG